MTDRGWVLQGATSMSMSMDRRSAAAAIGAGIISIPLASEAKGGDFPKVNPLAPPPGGPWTGGQAGDKDKQDGSWLSGVYRRLSHQRRHPHNHIACQNRGGTRAFPVPSLSQRAPSFWCPSLCQLFPGLPPLCPTRAVCVDCFHRILGSGQGTANSRPKFVPAVRQCPSHPVLVF